MRHRRRRPTVVAAVTALAALATAGCAIVEGPSPAAVGTTTNGSTGHTSRSDIAALQEEPMRIRLTIADRQATATLEDNPAARDLLSMLPVTIPMGDLFGREKPGPLPRALAGDVEPVFRYRVGQVAYWPPNHDIFVVYAGEGLPVPGPGLVPLGTVDDGLDVVADAGDDFELTITALD
ncbi:MULTISPECIES: cyclophilin-like fold protein [unclassified Geodermatophilus]|uniref:cyclophilin-like fold protein n=1 Tax=unclassified Geodermatophilus TaxID=2637632 RepID=UPI003EEE6FCB